MKNKKSLPVLLALAVSFLLLLLLRPTLFVTGADGIVAVLPCRPHLPLTIRFLHSVQKTPVEENLIVNDAMNGFVLQSTRYQSFGVGLPFLASEGDFYHDGNYFVMDMERFFPALTLRTGVGTQLTLTVDGREYRLHEKLPPGSRIDLLIAPYYQRFMLKDESLCKKI